MQSTAGADMLLVLQVLVIYKSLKWQYCTDYGTTTTTTTLQDENLENKNH